MGDGIHDYRCSGDCAPCGGSGLPGAVCPYCLNSGRCEGCATDGQIAYPADVARARERVVEAARRVDAGAPESLLERLELSIALAGLDAAEGGAGA